MLRFWNYTGSSIPEVWILRQFKDLDSKWYHESNSPSKVELALAVHKTKVGGKVWCKRFLMKKVADGLWDIQDKMAFDDDPIFHWDCIRR